MILSFLHNKNYEMNKNFILAGLVTTIINLLLHASAFFVFLKDFYATHPAGSKEYLEQLNRPPDQLIIWALLLSSLAFGFLITTTIK